MACSGGSRLCTRKAPRVGLWARWTRGSERRVLRGEADGGGGRCESEGKETWRP